MMVSATQTPLKGYAHHFLIDCYDQIDKENEAFHNFLKFLEREIKIEQ